MATLAALDVEASGGAVVMRVVATDVVDPFVEPLGDDCVAFDEQPATAANAASARSRRFIASTLMRTRTQRHCAPKHRK